MRILPLRLVIAWLIVALCARQELNAQTTTSGALAGVVTDQSGAVISDADVEIRDNAKGTTQSTTTDRTGVYQFPFLLPGRYKLTIAHPGFQEERRLVTIQVGPPVTVNVTLQIAKISNEITVTDEAPIIQAENADVSVTLNQRQVSEIPNPGNDLTYIAQTTPGAVMNTDGGFGAKFSILGMPGFSYGFTVDGMDITNNYNNSVRGGPLGLALGANQTEEATIVTATYSGQFGGAAGGNINYVSKSGSNAFHGNAQYYWNGTKCERLVHQGVRQSAAVLDCESMGRIIGRAAAQEQTVLLLRYGRTAGDYPSSTFPSDSISDHSLARSTSRNVRVQNSVESALPFALNSALPASR